MVKDLKGSNKLLTFFTLRNPCKFCIEMVEMQVLQDLYFVMDIVTK